MDWLSKAREIVGREGFVARVAILATLGPTPRAVGSHMLVSSEATFGKIGRGRVEAGAASIAREMIEQASRAGARGGGPTWLRRRVSFATGDVLGQQTGGSIEVLIEVLGRDEFHLLEQVVLERARDIFLARVVESGLPPELVGSADSPLSTHLEEGIAQLKLEPHALLALAKSADGEEYVIERIGAVRPTFNVYGTGLVARALVKLLSDLPFEVVWFDTSPGHFPRDVPERARCVSSPDLVRTVRETGGDGFHAVMTADHGLDLSVCRAILELGRFHYLGVVGSRLKRKRMLAHLRQEGFEDGALARIACPIGLREIKSKVPAVIAVAIAAEALSSLGQEG